MKITLPRTANDLQDRLVVLSACQAGRDSVRGMTLRQAWKAADCISPLFWWLEIGMKIPYERLSRIAEKAYNAAYANGTSEADEFRKLIGFDGHRPVRLVAGSKKRKRARR